MAYSKFNSNNFNIVVSDGNTVPSTNILGDKTYMDIGSGTILKLSWTLNIPQSDNKLDYYTLYIDAYDPNTGVVTRIFDNKIGNVKEFYITSSMLSNIDLSKFQIKISLKAHSIYGEAYSGVSSTLTLDIVRGCGTYIKVTDSYVQPIMKRTIAFSKLNYTPLIIDNKIIRDADGKILYVKAARAQAEDSGWALMQEFHSKDSNDVWHTSDVKYEVLTVTNENGLEEIVLDKNNEPIYVL